MDTSILVAFLVMIASTGTWLANESTHGGVAEAMGLGHHHMFDVGGYHCSDQADPRHQEHMDDHDAPYGVCAMDGHTHTQEGEGH